MGSDDEQESSDSASVKPLKGVASKRRSLGQFKARLERAIDVVKSTCRMIDPHGDGSVVHPTDTAKKELSERGTELEQVSQKYNARLVELLEGDVDDEGKPKPEYLKRYHGY